MSTLMSTFVFVSMSTSMFMFMFRGPWNWPILLMCSSALEEILGSQWHLVFEALFRIFENGILPNKPLTRTITPLMQERMYAEGSGYVEDVYV